LGLEVGWRVKIAARVPCTFALYVIHTDGDTVFTSVYRDIVGWVGEPALARLPSARATLKLATYLESEGKWENRRLRDWKRLGAYITHKLVVIA